MAHFTAFAQQIDAMKLGYRNHGAGCAAGIRGPRRRPIKAELGRERPYQQIVAGPRGAPLAGLGAIGAAIAIGRTLASENGPSVYDADRPDRFLFV